MLHDGLLYFVIYLTICKRQQEDDENKVEKTMLRVMLKQEILTCSLLKLKLYTNRLRYSFDNLHEYPTVHSYKICEDKIQMDCFEKLLGLVL